MAKPSKRFSILFGHDEDLALFIMAKVDQMGRISMPERRHIQSKRTSGLRKVLARRTVAPPARKGELRQGIRIVSDSKGQGTVG